MFNKITNPINNKSYSIYSTQGKNLLKSYVSLLNKKQLGGGVNVRGIEDANELQEGNFWLRVTGNVAGRHYSRIIQVPIPQDNNQNGIQYLQNFLQSVRNQLINTINGLNTNNLNLRFPPQIHVRHYDIIGSLRPLIMNSTYNDPLTINF